jgi:hypothetical protein
MSQDHHQPGSKPRSSELDATDLRGSDDVSRYTDHKKIAQALIEDYLSWYA